MERSRSGSRGGPKDVLASGQDKCVPAGVDARLKSSHRASMRDREGGSDRASVLSDEGAVGTRVCKDQDHPVDAPVAFLEVKPSLEGLPVGRARLGLDAEPQAAVGFDQGVPAAKVVGVRKWDLRRADEDVRVALAVRL